MNYCLVLFMYIPVHVHVDAVIFIVFPVGAVIFRSLFYSCLSKKKALQGLVYCSTSSTKNKVSMSMSCLFHSISFHNSNYAFLI